MASVCLTTGYFTTDGVLLYSPYCSRAFYLFSLVQELECPTFSLRDRRSVKSREPFPPHLNIAFTVQQAYYRRYYTPLPDDMEREPVKIESPVETSKETGSNTPLGMKDLWDAATDIIEVLAPEEQVKNSNPNQESGTEGKIEYTANINETGSKALEMKDLWDAAKDAFNVLAPEKVKNSNASQEIGTTTAGLKLVKREQVTNINETGSWEMKDLWDATKDAINIVLTLEKAKNSNPSQDNVTKIESEDK